MRHVTFLVANRIPPRSNAEGGKFQSFSDQGWYTSRFAKTGSDIPAIF
jgi:hypothetical protein